MRFLKTPDYKLAYEGAYRQTLDKYLRLKNAVSLSSITLAIKQEGRVGYYIWHTQDDEKVRESHQANNGKIFAWEDPPPTGHPGDEFGCRCWAEPLGRDVNNILTSGWGQSFNRSQWVQVGRVTETNNSFTFIAGDQIAIEASSVAFPPTNQFWFTVYHAPLDAVGDTQPSIATAEWFRSVRYSSGFTGAGSPNPFVITANPGGAPGGNLWTVEIPPQQAAHDNAMYNTLTVYELN